MINRTKKSRIPLYRDAAILLSKFRRLMKYQINKKEAKELLQNTFIAPDKMDVLFELYWIIKVIKEFEGNDINFELIEPGNNLIAQWRKKEYIYKIYHDSIGSFKFRVNISDIRKFVDRDGFLKRELKVIEELEKMTEKNLSDTLWGGRPDILLEKYHKEDKTENLISLFIGEVKYTDSMRYAIKGLRELLEYIALVKNGDGDKENYLEKNSDNLFQNMENISGGLFIDRIEDLTLGTGEKIKIFKFGDNNLGFFLGL